VPRGTARPSVLDQEPPMRAPMSLPAPLLQTGFRAGVAGRWRLLPLALLLLAIGCSGDGRDLPDADEFAAGPCRDAAPAVLAVDEQVRLAVEEDADRMAVRQALQAEQTRLQEVLGGGGDAPAELQEVVTRVGFARVALDANAMDPAVVTDVTSAVDRLVAVCVPDAE
jgi:hypothetical protein